MLYKKGPGIVRGLFFGTILCMSLFSCSGTRPDTLGIKQGTLGTCPASPNCVSSDSHDTEHHVQPIQLAHSSDISWPRIRQQVTGLPRTRIISYTDNYLHAECSSRLFGFVDDLELHLRAEENIIAVRSASRLGYSDLGVNRRRIEDLRTLLRDAGISR